MKYFKKSENEDIRLPFLYSCSCLNWAGTGLGMEAAFRYLPYKDPPLLDLTEKIDYVFSCIFFGNRY